MKALHKILVSSRRRAAVAPVACVIVALAFGAARGNDDYRNAPSPELKTSASPVRQTTRRPSRPSNAPRSRAASLTTIPNTSNRPNNSAPKGYANAPARDVKNAPANEKEQSVFSRLLHIPIRNANDEKDEPETNSEYKLPAIPDADSSREPVSPQISVQENPTPRSESKARLATQRNAVAQENNDAKAKAPQPVVPVVETNVGAKAGEALIEKPIEKPVEAPVDRQESLPPIEDFDEYQLAEILRPFAELNEQNLREMNDAPINDAPTQARAPETASDAAFDASEDAFPELDLPDLDLSNSDPTPASAPSPNHSQESVPATTDALDYEAFIEELDEIHELEENARNASEEPSYGYFKSKKPVAQPQPALEKGAVVSRPIHEPNVEPIVGPQDESNGDVNLEDVVLEDLDLTNARTDASPLDEGVLGDALLDSIESVDLPETGEAGEEGEASDPLDDSGRVADRRTFGETRPIDSVRAVGSQGYLPTKSANFKPVSVNSFTSNAYARGEDPVKPSPGATLELDDVDEFTEDAAQDHNDENDFLGAAIVDSSDLTEDEKALDSADVESLKDECFLALDHYSSLFIAYDQTAEWTETALEYVDEILGSLESNPRDAAVAIQKFKDHVAKSAEVKARILAEGKKDASQRNPWNETERPEIVARYTVSQRLGLFDSFTSALERRVFLWNCVAEFFAAKNAGKLVEQPELSAREIEIVLKTARDAQAFFGDSPNGRNWRASFDVDAIVFEAQRALETPESAARPIVATKQERDAERTTGYLGAPKAANAAERYLDQMQEAAVREELANDSVAVERSRRVRFLNDRINAAAYKIEKTPMTPEQRRVFEKPALAKYSQLAFALSGDQTNGLAALLAFERYERLGGGDAGRALQQAALRMTTSRSEPCRKLGRAFDAIYDNPNVKAYVSEALINRLLPVRDPEFAVVQERILDNPVVGTRRVDTQVSIQLIPNSSRLLMNLNVEGRAVANTSSAVFSAKLNNQSYVNYYGRKTIEWRDNGVAYSPASVSANAVNRLNSVETNVDFVPLVGDVAREITRSQYEARQYEIREETQQKTARETRERFDAEANERFDALNQRLRSNFFKNMANLGLSLKTQRSRTTDDWLLASLRLASDSSLGCQQTEPATLPGAFADVKLHESAVNAFLAQLEFAGKTMTPRQALDYLAVKLNKPQLKAVQIESDADVAFAFAKSDPIIVRFFEDQIQITLRLDRLTLNGNSWDNLEIETCYRPTAGETGAPALARDGVVSIYGVASAKDQIPIRAVFSKVFAANKTFELNPQVLQEDERFAGLGLGLCRVSRGWFAISVVRDSRFNSEKIPSRTL